jgi:hypothetical protein
MRQSTNNFSFWLEKNMIERFKRLIDVYAGGNVSNFSRLTGFNRQSLQRYLAGRNEKLIKKNLPLILRNLPEVNEEWVLRGEGKMRTEATAQVPVSVAGTPAVPVAVTPAVPILGLADCGMEGIEQIQHWVTTASPITLGPRAIAVLASGESMVPAGIISGNLCYCDPDQIPLMGEAVFLRQKDSKGALKLFLGPGEREGFTAFRGWHPAASPDGPQQDFILQVNNVLIDYIAPVIAVRRRL